MGSDVRGPTSRVGTPSCEAGVCSGATEARRDHAHRCRASIEQSKGVGYARRRCANQIHREPQRATRAPAAPPRRRGRNLGYAGGQRRVDVRGHAECRGRRSTRWSIGPGRPAGRTRRSRPIPTRSTSCPSSIRRMRARWCWRSLQPMASAQLPAALTRRGRRPSKTSVRPVWTRGRAGSTSFCRPATRNRHLRATSRCRRALTRASRCCAPTSGAPTTLKSPRRSPMARASGSIRSRRPRIHPTRCSSTRSP